MFERFHRDARDAVVEAQAVAREAGSRTIDGRHVLIALLDAPGPAATALRSVGVDIPALAAHVRREVRAGGLDAEALAALGIDLDAVRARADAVFGEGALDRPAHACRSGHLPFTADAKKSLELALREAVRLRSKEIDGGMLLLGILRATGSPAERDLRQALAAVDADPGTLRAAVENPEAQAS